jgi:hypothetical protein
MLWIVTFQFDAVIALSNGTWNLNLRMHKWSFKIQPTNQNMSMNNNREKCISAHFKQKTAARSSVNGVLAGSR